MGIWAWEGEVQAAGVNNQSPNIRALATDNVLPRTLQANLMFVADDMFKG
jgi:hypothetical protein